ncbi:MAG: arginine--tRNA ligase [Bifidobacteriaceae bacterium]|nr:arginine--tRNA ligase [Bifidobacteriaceae bacterium]
MTPAELADALRAAVIAEIDASALNLDPAGVPATPHLERPRDRSHGDWASNIALQLGKKAGIAPRDFASRLAGALADTPGIARLDVAGPGFLNITLDTAAAGVLARDIVQEGNAYGRGTALAGQWINVEFVSANPTGPIHLGGARWAAVGDAIARLLEADGAKVTREYYFNDHGAQIDHFAASLLARARGAEPPENGYGGQYVEDIARQVVDDAGPHLLALPNTTALETFRTRGVELMFVEIKASLHNFGVDFDVYFHEESLHSSGAVSAALDVLKASGALYQADGAWWLRSTQFGDDKDRVVIKSDGSPAYIAGDIAYLRDKKARGATHAIFLLGADHHGYIARLKAAAAAFGDDPDTVEVLIGQLVSLVRGGQPVRMSKRAGTVVTMEDLVDAVGVDAARYAMARSSMDSTLAIDLDLLAKHTNDNPVFYVQYAHARTANVARNAAALKVRREDAFDPAALNHPTEAELLGQLASLPRVVHQAAALREPHRVARYLEELAGAYHKWYDSCRVTPFGDDPVTDIHRTRLWLNDATRQVLANGLGLLGVSAPERM